MPQDKKKTARRPMDDNIDDLGRRHDGTTLDQPGAEKLNPKNQGTGEAARDDEDTDVRPPRR